MAAIKTNGTLWLWGDGNSGQLGNGVAARQSSPVQTVSGGTNWKQVSAGGHSFTTAIKTDGTLWTWGDNSLAQLGDNTLAAKLSPVQTAAGGTNWKQVSAAPGVGLLASGGVSSAAAIYFYDAGDLYPSK
jgi:alpha-tubulin suppressor-like RCC1 family protein